MEKGIDDANNGDEEGDHLFPYKMLPEFCDRYCSCCCCSNSCYCRCSPLFLPFFVRTQKGATTYLYTNTFYESLGELNHMFHVSYNENKHIPRETLLWWKKVMMMLTMEMRAMILFPYKMLTCTISIIVAGFLVFLPPPVVL